MQSVEVIPTEPLPPVLVDTAPAPKVSGLAKFLTILSRRRYWLVGLVLLIGAGWLGYHWAFRKAKVTFATSTVTRGDIERTVIAAGIVQPLSYVDVGAQTSGKLKSMRVKKGDQVVLNQLLAEIDPVLARTALTAASATLENVTSQRDVKQAQLVLATLQKDRNEAMFARQLIAGNEREITQASYNVALSDVASVTAQMKQASAAVNTAEANLGYTKITAPMAGEVVSISLLEGQTLNANQQAPNILRIADMTTMTVWAQVSEADIVRVKIDQDVYFTVLGQTRRWYGKVRQILPTPELINNVVFFDVLFDIPNPDHGLNIQMTAQVFIVLAQAKGVLLVSTAAVGNATTGDRVNVQVLRQDNSLEKRSITLGIKSEISAEVTDGLAEGEQVVIGGVTTQVQSSSKSPLTGRRGP